MGISKAWMKSTIFLKCCHWNSYKGKPHNRCVLEKLAWTCCIQVTLKQTSEITILFSNTRCHSAWKSPKISHLNFSILAFLMNLFSTQNLNVAHFARNVEWDFFCDFQTPCFPSNFDINLEKMKKKSKNSWKCVHILAKPCISYRFDEFFDKVSKF